MNYLDEHERNLGKIVIIGLLLTVILLFLGLAIH